MHVSLTEIEFNQFMKIINLTELLMGTPGSDSLNLLESEKLNETQRNKIILSVDLRRWQLYDSYDLKKILEFKQLTNENRRLILNFIHYLDFEKESLYKINSLYEITALLECKALTNAHRDQIFTVIRSNFRKLIVRAKDVVNLLQCKHIGNYDEIWHYFESNSSKILSLHLLSDIIALLKCDCLNEHQRTYVLSCINLKKAIFMHVDIIDRIRENSSKDVVIPPIFLSGLDEDREKLKELFNIEQLTRTHIDLILETIRDDKLKKLIPDEDERNTLLEMHLEQVTAIESQIRMC